MKKIISALIVTTIMVSVCSFASNTAKTTKGKVEESKSVIVFYENEKYNKYVGLEDIVRDTSVLGGAYKAYYSKYISYVAPNGKPITIVAQDKVSDEQLLKAYNVLSFYLFPYGEMDRTAVANKMAENGAVLVMPNGADGQSPIPEDALEGQPLYQLETPTTGGRWYMENNYEHRDAAYEEILHMVHDYGIGTVSTEGAAEEMQKRSIVGQ